MSNEIEKLKKLATKSKVTEIEYPELVKEKYREFAIVEDESDGFVSREQVDEYIEKYALSRLEKDI
ncbi:MULTISPECIES: hypothetical protein [unclassified Nosocomiicoccus]|uniref:hypothetical protein n=1 Tax=unclassified Nosocomiicoccus TaxID=2646683 RepID=UPI0008A3BAD1|nr:MULTISPECIES: hypothetical protein [unclassified Nosocomiicoccus]OFL48307.1 hypothetical protein HMPREF2767_08030 [Nosocomiicoccus sp. HMSC067E10]OFS63174.1 hypothetical protein HMPREF3177_03295 [Nosocomiicoccus sp. HMSC09A07]